jgi:hypothetical protein
MRVLFAVGKGALAYSFSMLYLAHLFAMGTAAKVARDALKS